MRAWRENRARGRLTQSPLHGALCHTQGLAESIALRRRTRAATPAGPNDGTLDSGSATTAAGRTGARARRGRVAERAP
eukprot:11226489-Lingulodinium_polyedra.AAC.1